MEYAFRDEETAYVVSTSTMESKKRTFFPIYIRRTAQIRVGAMLPLIKSE